MESSDEQDKIAELEKRVEGLETAEDDPAFLSHQTYRRYLTACDWDVNVAEKFLKATIGWRRETKPHNIVCTFCYEKPGYHSMRHVGFDKQDRPVLYANFAQCLTQHNTVEDAEQHLLDISENAIRAMPAHVHQLVWVMDFTGMKVSACNPRLARATEYLMSNHYPERLGAFVCVNHGVLFHAFWKAVKHFIPAATVKKVHMERHHDKIDSLFSELFPEELKLWLYEEIRLNKLHPMPEHQKEFWTPKSQGHDTRGCKSYIEKYLKNTDIEEEKAECNSYRPHPSILANITKSN